MGRVVAILWTCWPWGCDSYDGGVSAMVVKWQL
jgi:hypothetical protein